MPFLHVATRHPPASVAAACKGAFSAPAALDLLVVRSSALHLYRHVPHAAPRPLLVQHLRARIEAVQTVRCPDTSSSSTSSLDRVFVLTADRLWALLQYNATLHAFVACCQGDLSDALARPAEAAPLLASTVAGHAPHVVLHLYHGYLHILSFNAKGLARQHSVMLEELVLLDLCQWSVHDLVVSYLWQDAQGFRHVKSCRPLLSDDAAAAAAAAATAHGHHDNALPGVKRVRDGTCHRLLPLPCDGQAPATYSVVLVGQDALALVRPGHPAPPVHTHSLQGLVEFTAWTPVDAHHAKSGLHRALLTDRSGRLWMLGLDKTDMRLEHAGQACAATAMQYLDHGILFVGAHLSDSLALRLEPTPDERDHSYISVLDVYPTLAPAVDFCQVSRQGSTLSSLVVCAGGVAPATHSDPHGSLRLLQSGIRFASLCDLNLPQGTTIQALHAVAPTLDAASDTLIMSLSSGRNLVARLSMDAAHNITARVIPPDQEPFWHRDQPLLLAANLPAGSYVLQVHEHGWSIHDRDASSSTTPSTWTPDHDAFITHAALQGQKLVLASSARKMHLWTWSAETQRMDHAHTMDKLGGDVACLHLDAQNTLYASLWDGQGVLVLDASTLALLHIITLPPGTMASSLCSIVSDGAYFLLVGSTEGHLLCYRRAAPDAYHPVRDAHVGLLPVKIHAFSEAQALVLSEHAYWVRVDKARLDFAIMSLTDVTGACALALAAAPGTMALAKAHTVLLGHAETSQRYLIDPVSFSGDHELPRRVAWDAASDTLCAVLMTAKDGQAEASTEQQGLVRLLEASSMTVLDEHALRPHELVCSVACTTSLTHQPSFAVGTALFQAGDEAQHEGRLLVFTLSEQRTLVPACTLQLQGDVASLKVTLSHLVMGVRGKLHLCSLQSEEGQLKVQRHASCTSAFQLVDMDVCEQHILAADLVRSSRILVIEGAGTSSARLQEQAVDPRPRWLTSVSFLTPETALVADMMGNLVVLGTGEQRMPRVDEGAASPTPHYLEAMSVFHLGEQANRIVSGVLDTGVPSLASQGEQEGDDVFDRAPKLLSTSHGRIVATQLLRPEEYLLLARLQRNLARWVQTDAACDPGVFAFDAWRSFKDMMRVEPMRGFIDGDFIRQTLEQLRDAPSGALEQLVAGGGDAAGKYEAVGAGVEAVLALVEALERGG